MFKAKTMAVIAVLMIAGMAVAQPGLITLALNDSTQATLTRVNYPNDGTGWGVKFNPFSADANTRYVELSAVDVRLCPPPIDGYYQEQILIVPIVGGKPDMNPAHRIWLSDPEDVRVGYWWHHFDIPTDVDSRWIKAPAQVCVFALCYRGHAYMYQFFDGADNAPAGTQWFYDGSTAKRDRNAGDIMINLTYKKHDWSCNGIQNPTSRIFTPTVYISNIGGFVEPVDAIFWVTKGSTTVATAAPILAWSPGGFSPTPYTKTFSSINLTGVSGHEYKAHCQVEFHPAGHDYPFGERYTKNDEWTLPFQLYPFGTKVTPNSKDE